MKLKYEFKTVEVVDETVAVPVGDASDTFRGALKVNGTTLDILNLLKNNVTEDDIIEQLINVYNANREEVAKSVHFVIKQLREAGLLLE